jgi:hypothetical protein
LDEGSKAGQVIAGVITALIVYVFVTFFIAIGIRMVEFWLRVLS